jgi:hypothetical protein
MRAPDISLSTAEAVGDDLQPPALLDEQWFERVRRPHNAPM